MEKECSKALVMLSTSYDYQRIKLGCFGSMTGCYYTKTNFIKFTLKVYIAMHSYVKGYFYTDETKQIFYWLTHKAKKHFQKHWQWHLLLVWFLSLC